MDSEDQRNVTRYSLRSSNSNNKQAKPEPNNKDSKLPALDQQQLDSIRNDRVKLEAFRKRLIKEAIANTGSSDLVKRDQYFMLLGEVEVFLDILNNEQVISRGTAVQQNHSQFSSSSRHYLLSADDEGSYGTNLNATVTDPDGAVPTNSDNDIKLSATPVLAVDEMDSSDEEFDGSNAQDGSLDAIGAQIKKANRLILRRFKSVDNNKDDETRLILVEDDDTLLAVHAVQAALSTGRVKPFFHTLFLPKTFLNSRRSFADVTAGQVDEERQMNLDHDADNLDEIVVVDDSGNGRGAGSISDDGMASNWEFDWEQTNFAVELVNTDAQMLGNDVECTTFTSIPMMIMRGDKSPELLTRPESRGVVSDIFHRCQTPDDMNTTAAITGSPGIGKSWTLYYALQQALIYDGATVLFFFQKANVAVMYLRRDNKIYAWTSTSREFADSNLFRRSDVLVLLDPKEALLGGARYSSGDMKIVYAASNNTNHFTNDAAKTDGKFETFLGPPLDGELNVILARLDPSLKQDVIEARKKKVGNLIRYILCRKKCEARKDATDFAIRECAKNQDLLTQALWDEGMSKGVQTIPGTLLQVLPKRPEESTRLGYDGHRVKYRERVLQAANDNVRKAIWKAGREIVLSYRGKVSNEEYVKMGTSMEKKLSWI